MHKVVAGNSHTENASDYEKLDPGIKGVKNHCLEMKGRDAMPETLKIYKKTAESITKNHAKSQQPLQKLVTMFVLILVSIV